MLNFFIVICQILSFVIGIYILSENRLGKKFTLIMFLVTLVVSYPLFNILGIAAIVIVILSLVLCLVIKTKKIFMNITITFITIILAIISDHFSQLITGVLLGQNIEILREGKNFFIIAAVISLVLNTNFSLIMKKIFIKLQVYSIFNSSYKVLLVGLVTITVSVFYGNIFIGQYLGFNSRMILMMSILFLLYSMLLLVLFSIFNRITIKELYLEAEKIRIESERIQANQLREYTENMERYYEDMQNFRHDYKNMVLGLSGYIKAKDIKGIETYFTNNIEPIDKEMAFNNYHLTLLKNLKIQEIKGLLSSKLIRAQECKINTIIEVTEPIEKVNMSIVELCRALGIILDNAIEETIESSNPEIQIAFIKKEKSLLIVVINTCRDNLPTQRQMYVRGFSTKGEGRGLGLSILEEMVERSTNIYLSTYIKEGKFEQHLEIVNEGWEPLC